MIVRREMLRSDIRVFFGHFLKLLNSKFL